MRKLINFTLVFLIIGLVYIIYVNSDKNQDLKKKNLSKVERNSTSKPGGEKEDLELEEQKLLRIINQNKEQEKNKISKKNNAKEVIKVSGAKLLSPKIKRKNKEKTQAELKKEEEALLARLNSNAIKEKAIKPYVEKEILLVKKQKPKEKQSNEGLNKIKIIEKKKIKKTRNNDLKKVIEVSQTKVSTPITGRENTQVELKKEEKALLARLDSNATKQAEKKKEEVIKYDVEKEGLLVKKERAKREEFNQTEINKKKKITDLNESESKDVSKKKKLVKVLKRKKVKIINDFPDPDFDIVENELNLVTNTITKKNSVTISKDTAIRVGPGFNYPRINVLTKGDSVRLIKNYENWSKIIDKNGVISWLNNQDLE